VKLWRSTGAKHENALDTNAIVVAMALPGKNYIPLARPGSPGLLTSDFFQQQVAKQRNNNYHSTSLRNMVATSVNRTALHPGGVQPGKGHTELEEELHETAHIDYDRVSIVRNPLHRPYQLELVHSHDDEFSIASVY
jgi:hypothetical protein